VKLSRVAQDATRVRGPVRFTGRRACGRVWRAAQAQVARVKQEAEHPAGAGQAPAQAAAARTAKPSVRSAADFHKSDAQIHLRPP
jgi:hypothetical protein